MALAVSDLPVPEFTPRSELKVGQWAVAIGVGFGGAPLNLLRRHTIMQLGLTLAAPLGLRRLVIQDSWIDGFDPDSEFRRATRLVNTLVRDYATEQATVLSDSVYVLHVGQLAHH